MKSASKPEEIKKALRDAGSAAEKKKKRVKYAGRSIFEILEDEINRSSIPREEKDEKLQMLEKAKDKKVNILFAGPTGVGKSSMINALFQQVVADVGEGVEPETKELSRYDFGRIRIWDGPH